MKKLLLGTTLLFSLTLISCIQECEGECEILDDGTVECPCDDKF